MPDLHRRRLVSFLGAGLCLAVPAVALAEGGPEHAEPAPRPRPKPKAKPAHAAATPAADPHAAAAPAGHAAQPAVPPEEALARLMNGNARYVDGYSVHPHGDAPRRLQVSAGQSPFAVVLACADSRVAPELIFDQGLGDLFVIRVAGNVVDDAVLASIEYAVIHLGSTLVMTLGHERCGAVKATIEALAGRGSPDDAGTRIGALAALITPAVRAVPAGTADTLDAAVSLNAAQAAAEVFAGSRPLRTRVLAGQLKIVAARYDLDDGRVTPTKTQQA
ncbi:MAG: carbonic anhydrase [Phenylobacterium sp.]|uniref:carbonic anhydrase n=1 Tax=Phenylobacterium sp. TaxID=1871053 RepID=UPI0011FC0663|nr:carbonic anhydrase [Phenylobacterium sp.]TAJ69137.1 MAG: carbonic anhydrase [Phenylobacterium sp.]